MKIRNENRVPQKQMNELINGECFTTKRSNSKEDGIYLKIDKKSGGIISDRFAKDLQYILAVNLETGQLRKFNYDTKVTPLECAEIVY